jgi:hypothetical protein
MTQRAKWMLAGSGITLLWILAIVAAAMPSVN